MYKEKQLFVETASWQKVCFYPNRLDKQESQFGELCGLQQTVTSSMTCVRQTWKTLRKKTTWETLTPLGTYF